jgi:hypothetical protein
MLKAEGSSPLLFLVMKEMSRISTIVLLKP